MFFLKTGRRAVEFLQRSTKLKGEGEKTGCEVTAKPGRWALSRARGRRQNFRTEDPPGPLAGSSWPSTPSRKDRGGHFLGGVYIPALANMPRLPFWCHGAMNAMAHSVPSSLKRRIKAKRLFRVTSWLLKPNASAWQADQLPLKRSTRLRLCSPGPGIAPSFWHSPGALCCSYLDLGWQVWVLWRRHRAGC